MNLIEQKAKELYIALRGPDNQYNIDPLLLIALIALISDLINIAKLCTRNSQEVLDLGRKPGILVRMQMRKLIRRNMTEKQIGDIDKVIEKIKEVSWRTTVEEVSTMQSEAQ